MSDFRRFAESAEWNGCKQGFAARFILAGIGSHRACNRARGNGVNPNATRRQFEGKCTCESIDAGFRRRVCRRARMAYEANLAGDQDNRPGTILRHHLSACFCDLEGSGQIDIEDASPQRNVGVEPGTVFEHAGTGDQAVYRVSQ